MRGILFTTIFTLLVVRTKQISDEYNLLPFSQLEDKIPLVAGPDGFDVPEFSSNYVKIPLRSLKFGDKPISSPFILHTKFMLYELLSSCMFSIENRHTASMILKFEIARENFMRIVLSISDVEDIVVPLDQLVNNWTEMIFVVDDDKVEIYTECSELFDSKEILGKKTMKFTNDSYLVLGKSEIYNMDYTFPGAIHLIKLYPNADASSIKSICNVTDEYTEENDDPPENIIERGDGGDFDLGKEIFPDPPEKGERGDKGDQGERGFKGDKGEKGEKGEGGIKGEPGESIKGQAGPTGPPGKRGEEGKCQCSESVVSTLLRTMPEMRGPPGDSGPRGEDGPRGMTGLPGKTGPQGERGPQGLKGETGERGDDGRPGRDGEPGTKGERGEDGAPGAPGPVGSVGPPGPPGVGYVETEEEKKARQVIIPGDKGDQGPQGPPGPNGPKGERGEKGPMGEQGERGEKGEQGHKGLEGSRGEKGERGDAGEDGLPGIPGNHGNPGTKGDRGESGDKGTPGVAGLPGRLTELLDPDMDPIDYELIVEKLRGFKGDRGTTGEKGDKGNIGTPGTPGIDGKDGRDGEPGIHGSHGSRGEVGPMGPRGHKGDRGEPGPVGHVPESAIALMKGSKGDRGVPGVKGPPGPTGKQGNRGATGAKGHKGDRGYTGPVGPQGPPGLNGTIGLKGDKGECAVPDYRKIVGEKGERGEAGLPGADGKPGPSGPAGVCSECIHLPIAGPLGPPGPPGPPGLSITGPKGEPAAILPETTACKFCEGFNDDNFFDDDNDFHVTSTVMVRSRRALIRKTSKTPLGTLAYVLEENILLIRVQRGWQYVMMGSLLNAREPSTTPSPPPIPYHIMSSERPTVNVEVGQNYIRLAALNDPYSGRFRARARIGHNAADFQCNQQSLEYGGNFRAFLTNRELNAVSLVSRKERSLPVTNLKGELLFESWNSIFNGSEAKFVESPLNIYSFNSRNVMIDPHWPTKVVWHGSDTRGIRQMDSFCNEWESENPLHKGMASSLQHQKLLGQEYYNCDQKLIVLCVEVSASEPRRKRHSTKRRHSIHDAYEHNFIGG